MGALISLKEDSTSRVSRQVMPIASSRGPEAGAQYKAGRGYIPEQQAGEEVPSLGVLTAPSGVGLDP